MRIHDIILDLEFLTGPLYEAKPNNNAPKVSIKATRNFEKPPSKLTL